MEKIYDMIIIGAGVVGNAVARELSRYQFSIAVLEKQHDVCCETSARNSGVLHAGFNNKTGSKMAKLCVEGNLGF
ncbi:MAG TPA: FAD-dependent oxidoreductase, partial [Bacillota bacterium]|nr:FAD-dependent oxidoreductase [Bacillota bacterium]